MTEAVSAPEADRRTRALDVGVIGLGAMGGPIARNLVAAGLRVGGFDLDESRLRAHEEAGGAACESVEALALDAPVILTLLPSVSALESVSEAIARAADRRAEKPVLAEMSTFAEATKVAARDALAPHGVAVLDCPLSGTAVQAAVGDLIIYASGDEAAIDRCDDVFRRMARNVHRLGAFGNGTRTKLVANLLVAVHIVSAAEALVLARAAGLDPALTLGALTDGAGNSRMLEVRGPMMLAADFDNPSMTLRLFAKDEDLIRHFAAALAVPVPLFENASRLLRIASDSGHAEHDTSSVYASLVDALGSEA